MNLSSSFVTNTFFVLAFANIIIKFIKWIEIKSISSKAFLHLQMKYFISNFAIQIPLIMQGPFVYRRYIDDNLSDINIAHIKIVYNISASFFSIFIGHFLSSFDNRQIICISNIVSVVASTLRGIGTKTNFLIAAVLVGFASSNVRVSFDDWFISEETKITDCPNSHFIFTENLSLLNIVVSVIFLTFSDQLHKQRGTRGIFYFTAVLQFVGSLIVYFALTKSDVNDENKLKKDENLNRKNQQKKSFKEALRIVLKSENKLLIPMILLDQFYGILVSLFWPAVPSFFPDKKIPMAKIVGMGQLSILLGAMIVPLICKKIPSSVVLPLLFFCSSCCDFLMSFVFNFKFVLYWLIFALCLSDGCISSIMLGLKIKIYPASARGHILGVNKLCQSVFSSILIAFAERFEKCKQPLFSASILFCCSLFAFVIHILSYRKFQEKKDYE